ncbi:hypothetical protein CBR_g34577 [Chara braunii]|uniref:Retrotransposon gag domain-containing protein n=1 Tax=Chara braunii TaxID=69332 RepID=A0A388LJ73_CHABU|nr:hypothetical protein CBR_g34577 [Chara braunii]|eukprot:GBG82293.1 hypothetical protein CBR_g34577 [Chara braunii]
MGVHKDTGEYHPSPDRSLRELKERIRQHAPLGCAERPDDGEPEVMGGPVVTEPERPPSKIWMENITESPSFRGETEDRRSSAYERRDAREHRRRDDWRDQCIRDQAWRDRDSPHERSRPPQRIYDPQMGESYTLPYERRDRFIISHQPTELDTKPPVFKGYGITEYLEKWELHASRSQWCEDEFIVNFLFNSDPSLNQIIKEARSKDRKWTSYKTSLYELFKLEDIRYSIEDPESMTQGEDESVQAFGKRFQKISDSLIEKGKLSEVDRCTIFICRLPRGKQKGILRELPHDKLDFSTVLELAMKAGADDCKDLLWRGMQRWDFSLYREYGIDRCPDFNDQPWAERRYLMDRDRPPRPRDNETVIDEMREMIKVLARQVARIEAKTETIGYKARYESLNSLRCDRVMTGSAYSLRWDNRNSGSWRDAGDRNPRTLADYRAREQRYLIRRDDSSRYQGENRDRQVAHPRDYTRDRDNEYRRHGWVETYPQSPRYDRCPEDLPNAEEYLKTLDRYDHVTARDRHNNSRERDERGDVDRDYRNDARQESDLRPQDIRVLGGHEGYRRVEAQPSSPRNTCVCCCSDDHIGRDCPDLQKAIDYGIVRLRDRWCVKRNDDQRDASVFPSKNDDVKVRRALSNEVEAIPKSRSVRIFLPSVAKTPIVSNCVASTKSSWDLLSKERVVPEDQEGEEEEQKREFEEVAETVTTPLRQALSQCMRSSIRETPKRTQDEPTILIDPEQGKPILLTDEIFADSRSLADKPIANVVPIAHQSRPRALVRTVPRPFSLMRERACLMTSSTFLEVVSWGLCLTIR